MLLAGALSRLALVGCLLAIITALILPRRHNLARILQDILPDSLLVQIGAGLPTTAINDEQAADGSRPQDIIREPPGRSPRGSRTGGQSTGGVRKSSSSPAPAHAYFVPTPESSFHSAQAASRFPPPDQLTPGATGRGLQRPAAAPGQPAISLTVFTVTVVALILYTAMRMLTTRSGQQPAKGFRTLGNQSHFCKSKLQQETHNSACGGGHCFKPDTRPLERRKLAKLSRDERARELILHHGAKNVSQAIRFLTAELEKQRHQLAGLKNSSEASLNCDTLSATCSCACHHQHSTSGPTVQLSPTTNSPATTTTTTTTSDVMESAP